MYGFKTENCPVLVQCTIDMRTCTAGRKLFNNQIKPQRIQPLISGPAEYIRCILNDSGNPNRDGLYFSFFDAKRYFLDPVHWSIITALLHPGNGLQAIVPENKKAVRGRTALNI